MMGIEKIQFPLELIQISLNYQIKNISVSEIQPMLENISEMVKKNFNEKTGKIHFVVREDQLLENKHLEKLLLGLGDEIIVSSSMESP
jgi:CRISPR/Cas system CMR subunit Cmr6 (Cas7 group RAMP superfamily)